MGNAALPADGRLAERVAVDQDEENLMLLSVRDLVMANVEAKMHDISRAGMGISVEQELVLGRMVIITAGFHDEIPKKGVVMWSRSDGRKFRAGLKFVRGS